MRLNAGALALAFGAAGALEAMMFAAATGAMGGMMDGGVSSMHRSTDIASIYGSMMGGGFGFLVFAVVCGILGAPLRALCRRGSTTRPFPMMPRLINNGPAAPLVQRVFSCGEPSGALVLRIEEITDAPRAPFHPESLCEQRL